MAAPRTRRRVAWALAGGAVCAAVALLLVFGPDKDAPEERISNVPAEEPVREVKAPLPQEARDVAVRFIQTGDRTVLSYRKRGKRAGGGFPKTRMSDSIWGCCPESTSTICRRRT